MGVHVRAGNKIGSLKSVFELCGDTGDTEGRTEGKFLGGKNISDRETRMQKSSPDVSSELELSFRQQRIPLFPESQTLIQPLWARYAAIKQELDQMKAALHELRQEHTTLRHSWKEGLDAERAVLRSFLHLYTAPDAAGKIENDEFKQWATQYAVREGVRDAGTREQGSG